MTETTTLASGHTVKWLEGVELEEKQKLYKNYATGIVRLNPGRWMMPAEFLKGADYCYNFKLRPSDVFIVTYPKCGTTWMQEMVWTMLNNADGSNPKEHYGINFRCPFLEVDFLVDPESRPNLAPNSNIFRDFMELVPGGDLSKPLFIQLAEASPEPRTMKTHLPFSMLNPKLLNTVKVVYVARNPKDVCVSYHHHNRICAVTSYKGTLEQTVEDFIKGDMTFGSYAENLKEAWKLRHHPNMHFVFYEELKSNIALEIRRLNKFLDTKLTSEQLARVAERTTFNSMKAKDNIVIENSAAEGLYNLDVEKESGGFFRKGAVGSYQAELSEEMEKALDKWTGEQFKDLNIPFKFS